MGKDLGRVHVITGPGKGKTTAAFGVALRAAGHGFRVCVIQFMKTGMTTGELLAAKQIREIQVRQFGTGKFVDPEKITDDDRKCAQSAMEHAGSLLEKGGCDVLILDEVNVAADLGLVDPAAVLDVLKSRKAGVEVILSGRNAPKEFKDYADYVSYIDNRKHPFKKGLKARQGIEW
jgi:cob(I)alamin adenosyltransferase